MAPFSFVFIYLVGWFNWAGVFFIFFISEDCVISCAENSYCSGRIISILSNCISWRMALGAATRILSYRYHAPSLSYQYSPLPRFLQHKKSPAPASTQSGSIVPNITPRFSADGPRSNVFSERKRKRKKEKVGIGWRDASGYECLVRILSCGAGAGQYREEGIHL